MELLILCVVGFLFYLTPTIIANNRRHPQAVAIFALNIMLGWSMLGWVAAFVWSLTTVGGVRVTRSAELHTDEDSDNPYHPLAPAGQAWARGVADRQRFQSL
jgi:hypothetical protein